MCPCMLVRAQGVSGMGRTAVHGVGSIGGTHGSDGAEHSAGDGVDGVDEDSMWPSRDAAGAAHVQVGQECGVYWGDL